MTKTMKKGPVDFVKYTSDEVEEVHQVTNCIEILKATMC